MAEAEFPAILSDIDDILAESTEADILEIEDALESDFGVNLSFDWSTLRFRMDGRGSPVIVSGQEALVEDLVKALLTPRFRVGLYGGEYGAEFDELIGEPTFVVMPEIKRITAETILEDPRVSAIEDLTLTDLGDGTVAVKFSVRDFMGELLRVPNMVVRYADGN